MNQNVMTIYPAGTTNFDYQGYGTLYDAYSAEVTEASSTNGNITETMEITYPVNGVLSDKMVEGNLVKAQISKTDGDYQIFEIDETDKSDNTVITAYLNAYPYRVLRMSFTNGGKFANFETLTRLLDYAKSYMPDLPTDFKITTNISNPINLAQTQTDPALTPEPTVFKDFSSLLDAILNKVSGQVKFGPRSIEILAHRGQDKSNIELRDDKNTNGISVKVDTTNIVNKIIPLLPVKDKDGNSTSGTVVGNIVTPKDPFRFINFYSGQVVNVDTQDLANSYFSRTNCNYPVTTATVTTSMIDEDLSDIRLFDIVSVYSSRINYTAKLKVSERVFDVLAGAVESFKLGTSSVNVFSTQAAAMNRVEQAVAIGNQALTSANGKNTNYYGDSKPTDGKEGDTWFHTVDGVSQMDQFTGGVWKTIVSDTFGKEVDKKVATAQAEASDAKTKAEEASSNAMATAAKFDDTNQKAEQALSNSVSAQADASSAVAKANSTAAEFGTVKQKADSAVASALSAQNAASDAVAKAESTAAEFGTVSQKADSAVASALNAQSAASDAVKQASSAAADSKDAKQIAGAVSQSYKTLTDGSTMTIAELESGLAVKLTKTDLDGYATQTWAQNQIKTTADGINGTMSSIKGTVDSHTTSINDLKADSSSFKSQFTTVNNTLGKQTTDIGTLQATSKELTSGFNTLTSDNTTNKNDISQLKQTATEVSSTLETVKTQVQNSAVGTNLLVGTSSSEQSYTGDFSTFPGWANNTSLVPIIAVNVGSTYTYSINLTKLTGSFLLGYWGYDSNKNYNRWVYSGGYSSSGKVSWTFTVPSGISYIFPHVVHASDDFTCTAKEEKLEKGGLSTDWCLNPADNATVTAVSTLSQTVDGMKADISKKIEQKDLNGYATQTWTQNQIKTTADGINGTISSVKSTVDSQTTSINDLKADSSSFKSQFTTVNDTLGKQTTDIGSLQASSQELTSGFNTLTSDNTTNKNDISQLKQTSTEVSSTLETVKTQVENSAVGTNLLLNSSTFNATWNSDSGITLLTDLHPSNNTNTTAKFTQSVPYADYGLYSSDGSWKAGVTYTISLWAKTDTDQAQLVVESNSDVQSVFTLSKDWEYYSGQVRFQTDGRDLFIRAVYPSGQTFWVNSPKLEKGSHATDYSTNPLDNATVTAVSKISQTVDGMQTDISKKIEQKDLNGYATQDWSQNQIKMTADGINGTMSSIKSTIDSQTTSINDLQADSSSFKSQFMTVNDTIGKHTTDISTLQASSKELTSGFNTLTTDNTTNKNDISQLKQTATEVSSTLETVKTQVQNSAVGTNLLVGTSSSEQSYTGDFSTVHWSFDHPELAVNAGTTYTYSIYLTKLTGGFVLGYWGYDINKKYVVWTPSGYNSSSGKASWTFTVPSGISYITPHVVHASDDFTCTAKEEKLEKGSLATDWCPNPEDNATVTALSSISQTIDGIQTDISKKVDNTTYQAYVDQTDKGITSKVSITDFNNLTISNRNLALGTTTPIKIVGQNIDNQAQDTYQFSSVIPRGTVVTVSFDVSSSTGVGDFTMQFFGGDTDIGSSWQDISAGNLVNGTKHMSATVTTDSNHLNVRPRLDNATGDVEFSNFIISESSKEVSWSPAPEDLATQSQITQLKDDISLRVEKNGVVNAINISNEGTQIYGNKLHITADTYIDNAVIKDAMISNVSANKMTTGTLNAANVNVINLNGSHIVSNSITSNQLASGSVTADKIQSGAIRVSLNHSLQRLEIGVDGMNLMSNDGAIIGRIHSNHMTYDSTFWGLAFDMSANGGDYMTWGAQNNGDVNGAYQTKLAWYRWATHGFDGGFHFQDRVEFHNTVQFRNSIDTRANYLLEFGSTNVNGYSSVPFLGLSGGASKIAFSPGSVWMIRHHNYYNMGAVIEGFSHYLGKAIFIPTGMRSDGRASSWLGINIPSS